MDTDVFSHLMQLYTKLGHSLEEIRIRALKSLLSKVNLGLISVEKLSNETYVHTRLLDWFNLKNDLMVADVLNLIHELIQYPAGLRSFVKLGAVDFLNSLKFDLCSDQSSLVDVIIMKLKDVDSDNDDDKDENAFKLNYKPLTNFQVDSSLIHTPSTQNEVDSVDNDDDDNKPAHSYHYISNDNINDTTHDYDDCSRYNNISDHNSKCDHVKNEMFHWVDLTDADMIVLCSVVSSLNSKDVFTIIDMCNFLDHVIFHDFPVEVFLQRPQIIQSLLSLLPNFNNPDDTNNDISCTTTTTSTTTRFLQLSDSQMNESIAIITTLTCFCEIVRKRVNQHLCNPNYFENIYDFFPNLTVNNHHPNKNINNISNRLSNLHHSTTSTTLHTPHKLQWTVPHLCIALLEMIIPYLMEGGNDMLFLKSLGLFKCAAELLKKVNYIESVILNDSNLTQRLKIILSKLIDLMHSHHHSNVQRAADREKMNRQLMYVSVVSAISNFIDGLLFSSRTLLIPSLKDAIELITENISRDVYLTYTNLKLHEKFQTLSSLVDPSFIHRPANQSTLFIDSLKTCSQFLLSIRKNSIIDANDGDGDDNSDVISDNLKMNINVFNLNFSNNDFNGLDKSLILNNIDTSMRAFYSLKYHRSLSYLDHSITLVSQSSASSSSSSDIKIRCINLMEHILSHPENHLRLHAFSVISSMVKSALSINNCNPSKLPSSTKPHSPSLSTPSSSSLSSSLLQSSTLLTSSASPSSSVFLASLHFIVNPTILPLIIIQATTDPVPEIRDACYDILLHLLQCKLIVPPDFWALIITSLHSIIPISATMCLTNSMISKCLIGLYSGGPEMPVSINRDVVNDVANGVDSSRNIDFNNLIFWLSLMFNENNSKLRRQSTNKILEFLSLEENSTDKYPRLSAVDVDKVADMFISEDDESSRDDSTINETSCTNFKYNDKNSNPKKSLKRNKNHKNNKISKSEYVTKSACKENDITKLLNIITSADDSDIEILTSSTSQLAVMLYDTSLHDTFIRVGGVKTLMGLLKGAVLQCNSWNVRVRMVVKVVECIAHVVLLKRDVRKEMCRDVGMYCLMLRYALMFASQNNDEALVHVSTVLFIFIITRYDYDCNHHPHHHHHLCVQHQMLDRDDANDDRGDGGVDDDDVNAVRKKIKWKFSKYIEYIDNFFYIPFEMDFLSSLSSPPSSFSSSSSSPSFLICDECVNDIHELIDGLNNEEEEGGGDERMALEARMVWNVELYNGANNLIGAITRGSYGDPGMNNLRYNPKLNLTDDDKLYLCITSPISGIKQTICDLNKASSHLSVLNSIIRLHFYVANRITDIDVFGYLLDSDWIHFLKRFLSVKPSSLPDYSLLKNIIEFITSIINQAHKNQQINNSLLVKVARLVDWLIDNTLVHGCALFELFTKVVNDGSSCGIVLNEQLVKSLRITLFEYIGCILSFSNRHPPNKEHHYHHQHRPQPIKSLDISYHLINILTNEMKLGQSVQSSNLIGLVHILRIFSHITARPGWSNMDISMETQQSSSSPQILTLPVSYLKRIIETFHSGRGGDNMSYIGRGVFKLASMCMAHLCAEMGSMNNNDCNWPRFWTSVSNVDNRGDDGRCANHHHSIVAVNGGGLNNDIDVIDDILTSTTTSISHDSLIVNDFNPTTNNNNNDIKINIDWLFSLLLYRDIESCWAGLSIATTLTSTRSGQKLFLDYVSRNNSSNNLWTFALKLLMDDGECLILRKQAALLLVNMTSHCNNNNNNKDDNNNKVLKGNFNGRNNKVKVEEEDDEEDEDGQILLMNIQELLSLLEGMGFFNKLKSHLISTLTTHLYRHDNTTKWCRNKNINHEDTDNRSVNNNNKFTSVSTTTSSLLSSICRLLHNLVVCDVAVVELLNLCNVINQFISLFNMVVEVVMMNTDKHNTSKLFELSSNILQLISTSFLAVTILNKPPQTTATTAFKKTASKSEVTKSTAARSTATTTHVAATINNEERLSVTRLFDDVFLNQLILACCFNVKYCADVTQDNCNVGNDSDNDAYINELITSSHKLITIIITITPPITMTTKATLLMMIKKHWISLSSSILSILSSPCVPGCPLWFSTLNFLTLLAVEEGKMQDSEFSLSININDTRFWVFSELDGNSKLLNMMNSNATNCNKNNLQIYLSLVKLMNILSVNVSISSLNCKVALYETLKCLMVVCRSNDKSELLKAGFLDMIFNQIDVQINHLNNITTTNTTNTTSTNITSVTNTSTNKKVINQELMLLLELLNNFMYKCQEVKMAVCSNDNDSSATASTMKRKTTMMQVMMMMATVSPWKHNKYSDALLISSLLSLLICFTGDCSAACVLVSTTPPLMPILPTSTTTTTIIKQQHPVLNNILKFVLAMVNNDNKLQQCSLQQVEMLKKCFQILNNVVVCSEARSLIAKNTLLTDFVCRVNRLKINQSASKNQSLIDHSINQLFVSFICHMTFTSDGQSIISKVQGLIPVITDFCESSLPPPSSSSSSSSCLTFLTQSLLTLRNLSFHPHIRAKLLSNDKVTNLMLKCLEQSPGNPTIMSIACDCILNMVLCSQKLKSSLKNNIITFRMFHQLLQCNKTFINLNINNNNNSNNNNIDVINSSNNVQSSDVYGTIDRLLNDITFALNN